MAPARAQVVIGYSQLHKGSRHRTIGVGAATLFAIAANHYSQRSFRQEGPSAHSYLPPWRSSNEASIERYNGQLLNGAGFLDRNYEYISPLLAAEEYLLTRLRTKEGISLGEMWANGWALPSDAIAEMVHQGMLQQQGERIALTDKGLDFADRVIIALASDV